MQALEEAVTALGESGTDAFRAILLARLTRAVRYAPGFGRRGPVLAREALAAARRSGDVRALSSALLSQRVVSHGPEGVHDRLGAANELHELVTARGLPTEMLEAAPLRIMSLFEVGDHLRSREAVARFGDLADVSRRPFHRWCAEHLRAVVATQSGHFAEAERHIVHARDVGIEAQLPDVMTVFSTQLVMLRRDEGRLTELEALIVDMNRRIPGRPWNAVLAWTMACADTIARAGATDKAADLYDELAPYSGTDIVIGPGVAWIGPVDHYLGVLAACVGRHTLARTHLEHAKASTAALGRCPAFVRSEAALASI